MEDVEETNKSNKCPIPHCGGILKKQSWPEFAKGKTASSISCCICGRTVFYKIPETENIDNGWHQGFVKG